MTTQIPNDLTYRSRYYVVANTSERPLFHPDMLGFEPVAVTTSCWRGFFATFAVVDSHLILDALQVNLPEDDSDSGYARPGPRGAGLSPFSPPNFNTSYSDLGHRLHYTGGLLLGQRLSNDLPFVMPMFYPAYAYKTVLELVFQDGLLEDEYDRSEEVAEIRRKIKEAREQRRPSTSEIRQLVEGAFARTYRLDFPGFYRLDVG